ncbi:DUF4153 domain-containing protein [Nocardioides insulae]|uniref:DUF4153 domain-containing protein n=1 Tax=Nocardioides insulae TaxID=394734 RepID=UPI0003F86F0A|nr:DUF4153 domain-containing protein [Nocardioides insulae]
MSAEPLAGITSIKVKLGLLVAASVAVTVVVATLGSASGVPVWLSIPVTVLLALAVTQLLAVGMTAPLRQMTAAARRMATGDYAVRVEESSRDEVGELARAFNTMARDLAGVDRQRRDLVANVSHELRTPLTGLRAVLENVVDGVAPRESLEAALAQAERMSGLVEDLLDLARTDAGKVPLNPRPVPLAGLLGDAVAEARTLGREVTYDVRVTPPDLVVRADPDRLRQLVANLLDNASRHSPAGGRVTVTVVAVGERYRLEVQDQGPGVPPAARDRVFEPFGTLSAPPSNARDMSDPSGAGEGGGTGLGLAIARWVTDLHGGSILFVDPVDDATGTGPGSPAAHPHVRGARVRVDLPLLPPHRVPAATEPTTEPIHPEEPSMSVVPPNPPPAAPTPPGPAPAPVGPERTAAQVPAPPILDDILGDFWPERDVPARTSLLFGALGVGVLAGAVLPFRDLGLGTFLVLLAAGGVIVAAIRGRRDPFTLTSVALCVLLAAVTVLRDAEWIAVLCLLGGGMLCACTVTRARTAFGFVVSGLAWPLAGIRGLPWLGRTLGRLTGLGRSAALLRTLVWCVLGLLVFGALFVSADALLAQWVDDLLPDLTAGTAVLRAFVTAAVGGIVLAAAYLALNPPRVDREPSAQREVSRRFEWLAPVLVVVGVFAAFLVAQATVIFGGHDYLQRTTGLTYAEYVHQGFAQLTVATALTLMVVWAAARKAPRTTSSDRFWLRGALGVLCLQTLVVVASALYRMHVYQEAYGFTGLRVLVDVFEAWLGLLVVAVLVAGVALRGGWLPRFALISGVVALLGLAAINPDAWVAQRNLDRYDEVGRVDWTYLRGLSDDAVPVFAELPEDLRACVLQGREQSEDDWLEWNLGRSRADRDLAEVPFAVSVTCPPER